MTGYEQKIELLRGASGKQSGKATRRFLLASVLLGLVVLVLGFLEYRQKDIGQPTPPPTCCAQPLDAPQPPHP
jgi:hypothetical protein